MTAARRPWADRPVITALAKPPPLPTQKFRGLRLPLWVLIAQLESP